jgi:mono/diheme cytochrome c family protein
MKATVVVVLSMIMALAFEARSPAVGQKPAAAQPLSNEQDLRGEALFVQNCPLCHVSSKRKERLGIQGRVLQGMYSEDSDDSLLRQIIEQGFAGKMPAFRYTLDQKQVDDLVAFLKAGAHLTAPTEDME